MFVGRAHYFLGNWQEARDALQKGIELRRDKKPTLTGGPRWWYLTMALHRLGEVEKARAYYDQLVKELEQNPPGYDSSKYLAEAAEVLGIELPPNETEQTPDVKEQPPGKSENAESN